MRYDRKADRIVVDLASSATFAFPPSLGQGLEAATPDQLAQVEIAGAGFGLHWEALDVDLSVPALMTGSFGTKAWMSELARRAGSVTSPAKAAAARVNGAKGGVGRRRWGEDWNTVTVATILTPQTHLKHISDSKSHGCPYRTHTGVSTNMLSTIGYERSTLADFIATLQLAKIDTLVDVRERAQSRRPGFSKKALQAALQDAGIEYLHFPQLGDPKEGRDAARAGKMVMFLKIYDAVINGQPAQEALAYLENLVSEKSICLMCFERDQKECHRKIVAENLEARLNIKATHWGVVMGAANGGRERRVLHTYQGATASLQ